jgi:hypothetical protein
MVKFGAHDIGEPGTEETLGDKQVHHTVALRGHDGNRKQYRRDDRKISMVRMSTLSKPTPKNPAMEPMAETYRQCEYDAKDTDKEDMRAPNIDPRKTSRQ